MAFRRQEVPKFEGQVTDFPVNHYPIDFTSSALRRLRSCRDNNNTGIHCDLGAIVIATTLENMQISQLSVE